MTAPESVDMTEAVGLPGAAMGGYAGLRLAAQRVPAVNSAITAARGQSYRGLLAATKAPAFAARQAAGRGAAAASRAAASAAAKAAPRLLARGGMLTLSRAALAPLPIVGEVALAATWLFDKDSRSLVNGLISCIGGVGFPPDGNAPPAPPRTQFLPLTHDGNRDPEIEKIDQGMTKTNGAAFNYRPDDVWPSSPAIETTPDFKNTMTEINKLGPKASGIADSIRNAANSLTSDSSGNFASALPTKLGPLADALDKYKTAVAPGVSAAINGVTTNANDLYQKFREINNQNRAEIANSTSGLIPFAANHVNVSKMDDTIAAAKNAAQEISKHNTAASGAISNWSVPSATANGALGPTVPVSSVHPTGPDKPAPAGPAVGPVSPLPQAPAPSENPTSKSPLDGLLNSLPASAPSMPGGFPMPQIPGLPQGGPQPGVNPMSDQQPLDDHKDHDKDKEDKAKDDKAKDKDGDPKPDDPGTKGDPQAPGAVTTVPAGLTGAKPTPVPPPPGADRTVRIGNKDYTFDSPRMAAAIRESQQAAQNGPGIPIPQALAENGYTIPPVGQPIGQQVEGGVTKAEPGAVIVSNNGADHAWYLGNGEAMNEQGQVKPVAEVINPVGPNDGIFKMPDPGTPVVDPTASPAGQGARSTSPPTVGTADIPPAGGNDPGQSQPGSAPNPAGQPFPQPRGT
ncbi:hypothetical protein [Mycobacterium intracellulare]|uniref:hypothetical protein n=1 Tax=Mycobacterium intracellulare TaxID=1767 RepID=UPI001EEDD548|nr:hypothetical protein [Mycobacterium intracellulare]MEE3755259.1 hypothetical protein [Mycobacterium intracellulare]